MEKFSEEWFDKLEEAEEFIGFLGIPPIIGTTNDFMMELCDYFMDDEKVKMLISKLRNKAFW